MLALIGMVDRGDLARLLAQEPRPGRPVGGSNRRLSSADVDQLVVDYQAGVGSIFRLAKLYGVHRNTVAMHLKERGVSLGRPMQPSEIERAQELNDQGLSLNAIGKAIRRDPKTVKKGLSSTAQVAVRR